MRILISADIEGVANVFHPEQTRAGNPEYERARRWMTAEADAAVRGAFEGGATEVIVNDSGREALAEAVRKFWSERVQPVLDQHRAAADADDGKGWRRW